MEVVLVTHASAKAHDAGWGHPERPERIDAAIAGVHLRGLAVVEMEAERATTAQLEVVHDSTYIAAVEHFCRLGGGAFDPDTRVVEASWEAALRSAGGGLTALSAVDESRDRIGFVVMRPPGHHALEAQAMGFCLFNNIAVAARSLTQRGERVAIVDWDVHHGNGTQAMFEDDPSVLYVSFHQSPFYPFTGRGEEIGIGAAIGTMVNLGFPAGTTGVTYHDAMGRAVMPVLADFAPDHLLVSAGYDAHTNDPLAALRLEAHDYGSMAAQLREGLGDIPTVFFLEGGYDLAAIESSVATSILGSAGSHHIEQPHDVPSHTRTITDEMVARLAKHHPSLG